MTFFGKGARRGSSRGGLPRTAGRHRCCRFAASATTSRRSSYEAEPAARDYDAGNGRASLHCSRLSRTALSNRFRGTRRRPSFPIQDNQELQDPAAFEKWLKANHAREPRSDPDLGHDSGATTVTHAERWRYAVLGMIDAIRKA